MKRLFLLCLLVLGGFYIAWPAYSAYQLVMGLKNADQTTITNKVAWNPLRSGLRPVFAAKVEKELGRAADRGGVGDLLKGGAAKSLAPQLVDKMLTSYVTPLGLTKLAKSGGQIDMGDMNLGSLLGGLTKGDSNAEANGNSGGGLLGDLVKKAGEIAAVVPGGKEELAKLAKKAMGSKEKEPTSTASNEKGTSLFKYGLDNIKSFRMVSPWEFEIGVAKDPKATEADLTAGMGFSDFDWKLTKFVPKI